MTCRVNARARTDGRGSRSPEGSRRRYILRLTKCRGILDTATGASRSMRKAGRRRFLAEAHRVREIGVGYNSPRIAVAGLATQRGRYDENTSAPGNDARGRFFLYADSHHDALAPHGRLGPSLHGFVDILGSVLVASMASSRLSLYVSRSETFDREIRGRAKHPLICACNAFTPSRMSSVSRCRYRPSRLRRQYSRYSVNQVVQALVRFCSAGPCARIHIGVS